MQPLIVVQCRLMSTRLPGKALYPLAGLPLLVFLLRRLRAASLPGRIILATTIQAADDPVAAWGEAEGVPVVRGESEDVLARYLRCLALYPASAVVRVTADNPLTDGDTAAKVLEALRSGRWDYVSAVNGYPCGAGVDGFSAELLETINRETLEKRHREHLNAFVLDHPYRFRRLEIAPPPELTRPDVRLTIDTFEDWTRIVNLLGADNGCAYTLDLKDAIERFDQADL
ncbi:MAG: NTP transferase domain-containing protein [Pseudomonadota bacterium]